MSVTLSDLQALPPPEFFLVGDTDTIKAARIARVTAILNAGEYPYDVGMLETDLVPLVETAGAYRDTLQAQAINEVARQLLVAFAKGGNLDQRGAGNATPRLAGEEDDHYRVRVANALERPSTAGSAAGYREWAKAADPDVFDVAVVRPGPPRVLIYVLGYGGAPSAATLAAVQAKLSPDDVRPQNDFPEVYAAGIVTIDIAGVYDLYPGADAATCKALGDAAITAYVAKHYALGHDITLDGVKAAALVPGVRKFAATLNGLAADQVLNGTQAPKLGALATTVADGRDV